MKVTFRNSTLDFKLKKEPTTGIFNVSDTRVNQIYKDGCSAENPFFESFSPYQINTYVAAYENKEVANATGLTYADVFLWNNKKANVTSLWLPKFGISQHITYGFWVKYNGVAPGLSGSTFINSIWYIVDDNGNKVGKTTAQLNKANTATGVLSDANATVTMTVTTKTLGEETWLFFEIHIDFETTPSAGVQVQLFALDKAQATEGIISANHTLIYDNVTLDPMTYYPAEGHNPKKG